MKDQVSVRTQRSRMHGIRKADLVLIVICLLAAVLLGVFFMVHREAGSAVCILHDGMELKKIDLYSAQTDSEADAGRYYLIAYRGDAADVEVFESRPGLPEGTGYISYNLISVTNGAVIMEAADCKDQICVRHKPVSSKGESIICLPHRLVVEIVGSEGTAWSVGDGISDTISDGPLDGVVR